MSEDVTAYGDGSAEPSEEQLVAEGAAALRELLASEPTTEEELVAVLDRRLGEPMTSDTWSQVVHSFTSYVGERGFYALAWAGISDPGDETRLQTLEHEGGRTVANLARRITAQFGDELRYAHEISGQLRENWRLLNRDVYRDLVNDSYYLRIQIEKYGGDTAVIEGPPDSILGLATFLIGALRFTGEASELSDERLSEFAAELGPFTKLLEPRLQELSGEEEAARAQAPS